MAPLRTIVLFHSSNTVNALNGHHPKKTALKQPALGLYGRNTGDRDGHRPHSEPVFEPVDLDEHHIAFLK